jgi:hypothetical protein
LFQYTVRKHLPSRTRQLTDYCAVEIVETLRHLENRHLA